MLATGHRLVSMISALLLWLVLSALLGTNSNIHAASQAPAVASAAKVQGDTGGYSTNTVAVYRLVVTWRTNATPNPRFGLTNNLPQLSDTNRLPLAVIERIRKMRLSEPPFLTNSYAETNREFVHFVPGSLNNAVWTNVMARTNGRAMAIWSKRQHPLTWPLSAPVVEWNHNSLIWGMKGVTALSPCWEKEGASGQVPITLLTPRHGYTRGHGMGPEGFRTAFNGDKVWFVTQQNEVLEVRVTGAIVHYGGGRDYTLLMFNKDLPPSIDPLRVMSQADVNAYYPWPPNAAPVLLRTEQEGNVSADIPGFSFPTMKGGDSGSPNMIPIGDELVFVGGRTTSAPSREMQLDIDDLCARAKVDTSKYQLQWFDLSGWPRY